MMGLAKMVTGLAARSGVGPWVRVILFVAMAFGAWQFWVWLDVADHFSGVNLVSGMTAVAGIASLLAVLNHGIENDVRGRGWRYSRRRMPLALWMEMTDKGRDIRLWAILIWPLLLPGELAVCVLVAVAAVFVGIARILNVRLK